jgi:hypothetical protein
MWRERLEATFMFTERGDDRGVGEYDGLERRGWVLDILNIRMRVIAAIIRPGETMLVVWVTKHPSGLADR